MSLEYYQKLKVVKKFEDGCKSNGAYLLEEEVVKKVYDSHNPIHVKRFLIEIDNLRYLKKCSFVPKILAIDKKKCTFYMNYCGKKPLETEENLEKTRKLLEELHKKWKIVRKSVKSPKYKVALENTAIMDDKMYIIDFGSSNWIRIKK